MGSGNEKVNDGQAQMAELGTKLRSIREAQGLTLDDVMDKTKIQKRHLDAIENGALELLPKGPYARGFTRQYCEFLSAGDLWNTYDALTKRQKPAVSVPQTDDERNYGASPRVFKPKSFIWLYLLIAISLAGAAWITWHYRSDFADVATSPIDGGTAAVTETAASRPAPPENAAVPSAGPASVEPPVDLSWMDGDSQAKAEQPPALSRDIPLVKSKPLRITAKGGHAWIKVSQGTTIFFEGVLKPEESKEYEVGPNNSIRVRFGNPIKTSVLWNGKTIAPVEPSSKPATRFFHPNGDVTEK